MGRQYYEACGSDGICTGNQLWFFLGNQAGWYDKTPDEIIASMGVANNLNTADSILGQPEYPGTPAADTYRSGFEWNRPFYYGNYSMFPGQEGSLKETYSGPGENQIFVNNTTYTYVVMSPQQMDNWR